MEDYDVLDFFGRHLKIGDSVVYIYDGSLTTGKITGVENKKLGYLQYQLLVSIKSDFKVDYEKDTDYPIHTIDARTGIILNEFY